MDSAQNLREIVLGRGRRGEPSHGRAFVGLGLGERTVRDQRVQVNEKSKVIPKTLHDDDDTGMQRSRGVKRVMPSGPAPLPSPMTARAKHRLTRASRAPS